VEPEVVENNAMRLKIKWSDDRVRGATTAILLIGRERLARGEMEGLVRAALAEYRADPAGYKEKKRTWPDAHDLGPLITLAHVVYYRRLEAAVARLMERMTQGKRQFNSLLELDNYLIACLGRVK
jgi:hypothetical protein